MKLFLVDQGQLNEVNKPIFSTGDCYIADDDRTIYVWIGSKCSVDEKTAAAAQARTLDQQRGGAARVMTVDQNQEPQEFLKLINMMGTMKVVERNVAKTMLKDVVTGDYAQFADHINVLYRVSSEEFDGINAMKMIQVPYAQDSLDTEDCYVLDLGNKVYIWQGAACNVKEKVKSGQWAREIDADRAGLQNETIFEEGDDAEFFAALGKGEHYKESDAVQLRAESELEPETVADTMAAEIEPELKSEVREVTPAEIKADIERTTSASSAGPGIPGKVDDSIFTIEKSDGRRRCPNCGNENKTLLHESTDKTNIILDYPRVYGKKFKCGECGLEWREK